MKRPTKTRGCFAFVTTPRREVVLQLRDEKSGIAWPGHWSLPGGGSEADETPFETVLRELLGETGIVPETIEEVPVTAYEKGKTPPHLFAVSWDGTESDLVLGEGQALSLFPLDTLPEPMPPHVRHYIEQLAPRRTPPYP
ncbi:NUDIX domain-containing protein [Streptomyces sp. GbtcB6]|uniref:NUDIX domain-containing protein n=1 Tax=Streptomyces sp. GbtcB6 TaxID=2824751 RepID=UPI001C2F2204|nr:NUDIX domain-containing protein [Streptomyces sp. GbtcB6]